MSFVELATNEGSFLGAMTVLTETEIYGGYLGFIDLPTISRTDVEVSTSQVAMELLVAPGAIVTQAVARVTADAPGTTNIGGIATVRAAAGEPASSSTQLVVDFGTLRTVSALAASTAIDGVTPWVGTRFDGEVDGFLSSLSRHELSFTELQTERLLIDLATAQSPADLAASGLVTTTTPPADLELRVGATRVWFRPGPAPGGFSEDVDVTSAVQAVVDAGGVPGADGNLAVSLVLSARVPGELGLALPEEPRFLRTLTVDFPGTTTRIAFPEEGVADVVVPVPADVVAATIHRVVATVAAEDRGPLRVLPPVDPIISTDAELVLDPDRRLVAKLPPGPLGRMGRVAGVRLLLAPGVGGIEVTGALLAGTSEVPGDPLPDATLTPVNLPAGGRAWATLGLPRAIEYEPDPTAALWVSVAVTRGSAVLALADPQGVPAQDVAVLRRVAPNGIVHPPSTAVRHRNDPRAAADVIPTDALALRVVGESQDRAPIPVADVDLAGGGSARTAGTGGSTAMTVDPPGLRSPLTLQVTATAATTVTVGPVVIAYTDPGDPS